MTRGPEESGAVRYRLRGDVGGTERRFVLGGGRIGVGSLGDNGVVLPVRGVSRRHATIVATGDGLVLEDLGSKNGVVVNGTRVKRSLLRPGDEIRLGPVTLALERIDSLDTELGLRFEQPVPVEDASTSGDSTTATTQGAEQTRPAWRERLRFPDRHVPGNSPAMTATYARAASVARSDLPVLIQGETGVGKEDMARILHLSSSRGDGPFMAINCAAIPTDLLEAELFGIAKGVATGVAERSGRFQQAEGGTLFLDEIGDMSVGLQAKLLRALEEKQVVPVGGRPVAVDLRLVTATNSDLERRIEAGQFRQDLYFRIAGDTLRIPPLRERRDEIPGLVQAFVAAFAVQEGRRIRGVSVKALEVLTGYDWPGNVRELRHEVRRLVSQCSDGEVIDSGMLAERLAGPSATAHDPAPATLEIEPNVQRLEARLIREALARAGGNRSEAARLLGISRNGLALKMRRLGLGD